MRHPLPLHCFEFHGEIRPLGDQRLQPSLRQLIGCAESRQHFNLGKAGLLELIFFQRELVRQFEPLLLTLPPLGLGRLFLTSG
jgi:hypothetical protein